MRSSRLMNQRWWWRQPPALSEPLYSWLTERQSLTDRLRSICEEFHVVVHQSRFDKVCPDETFLLVGDRHQRATALVREVSLVCDGRPLVFGHSILMTRKPGLLAQSFKRMGDRSLGSMLFANPDIWRGVLYFKRIDRRHVLYAKSVVALGEEPPPFFWARRSVFSLRSECVCVTEVFSSQLATARSFTL
ncbi:MAG: chorismate lyase [Proteobacteria bacterium]|nr:chorismate lyase [Pseudomonadota bacterium]MCL2310808.1 chorismate lyase [Pseudomonadota bacterium]